MTLLATAVLGAAAIAALGATTIRAQVLDEAQARVDHDLKIVGAEFDRQLQALGESFAEAAAGLTLEEPGLDQRLAAIRTRHRLSLVNVCDIRGRRVAGDFDPAAPPAEPSRDPVLRAALGGEAAWGTMHLAPRRLYAEGGEALASAVALPGHAIDDGPGALFWWMAVPLRAADGHVHALVYGGRSLNHDLELVDRLRGLTLGDERYEGKPLGTVTLFLGPTRIATNVVDGQGRRAVGTQVSDAVAKHVLVQGERWSDRAEVVDSWYLSGYEPIRDPDRNIAGMLYVGLLEAPYRDLQRKRMLQFTGIVALVGLLSLFSLLWLLRRITRPLERLSLAANALAREDESHAFEVPRTYAEFRSLADSFETMRGAIVDRDRRLKARNGELADANEALTRLNANYMDMLGFVTHELKAPLGAIQMMSGIVTDQYGDSVPEAAGKFLHRIRRNCEELQGMVKDYLDLSRAERGELVAEMTDIDLRADVIDPCLLQAESLLSSRDMTLEIDAPESMPVRADAELLRIALSNFLSNAAKYGRPGGVARVEAGRDGDAVTLAVWNEGEGFSPEEGATLFGRFTRLKNKNTRDKRGSGLGLFLVRGIAEQHGGTATAESETGAWARFRLDLRIGR